MSHREPDAAAEAVGVPVASDDDAAPDTARAELTPRPRFDPRRFDPRRLGPSLLAPGISWLVGTALVTAFFAIGAWQRRWIADDGLIVLRTVLNLLAGNGPVFNAGERVEANTSTAWTYLLTFITWVTGGQVEYVVLWTAFVLSVAAIPIAMYGTARLYGPRYLRAAGSFTLLLPLGSVIYIALPPARDFATSGLENGLVICWIACLWCLFLAWARRDRARTDVRAKAAFLFLAFLAGLAPLIRPEITVLGALVLLVLFCAPIGWRLRVGMVAAAAALPVGYQIFRMGYYAVLVPNPAIAKDASGAKWEQGFTYLGNLFSPYALLLPVILAVLVGLVLVVTRVRTPAIAIVDDGDSGATGTTDDILGAETAPITLGSRWRGFQDRLQRPSTVVLTVLLAGLVLTLYWLRQGGDFMHGRVLLAPLFILLLPVMVVPATVPLAARTAIARWRLAAAAFIILVVGGTAWWAAAISQNVLSDAGMDISRDGIVDERRFYVANMANENPITAEDYLEYPRMRAMVDKINEAQASGGGVLLPSGSYDEWFLVPLRKDLPPDQQDRTTLYFLNLGMTGMNAPLDVRVVDQMGLAYPLAAHTERLPDGRIGHDKNLGSQWVVAESGGVAGGPGLPGFIPILEVRRANVALTCPQTQDRFASYKETWSFARFRHNLRQAVEFNSYRIVRQPEYEILRCGLTPPVEHK
ncbi:MAG: flagellar motor control protein ZomB [Gordonia sp. (in: high G+C Gram-positive bacteria)]|uniref:flagellar motor control protein ZomB n=1 Tax=Gordonia sp. (in: high G+C Gram-positive bacteria) TaxID=84139 RepID=UPI003BB4A527